MAGMLVFSSCKKAPQFGGFQLADQFSGDPGTVDSIQASSLFAPITCKAPLAKGLRAWRRLSNAEFKNTVTAVFGLTNVNYSGLTTDISHQDIYDTLMVPSNYVNEQRFGTFRAVAKDIASKVDLAKTFPCLSSGVGCILTTSKTLAEKAWRRPLLDVEVAGLAAVFTGTQADVGPEQAARFVIEAIVLAQSFLYRSELGIKAADGTYTLSDYEMASALSYSILRKPPDDTLLALAKGKSLSSRAAITAQVNRLFADPQAKSAWKDFASMWLDSNKILEADRTGIAEFTPALAAAASKETGDLFADTLSKKTGGTLNALLTSDSIPSSNVLSTIYSSVAANGILKFKETDRRGPLGLASFLIATSAVDHTSPVKRGVFVLKRLMCSNFAPFAKASLPPKTATQTNRDVYLGLEKGSCGGCHKPMNDIGFIFENFDMMGRYRTTADSQPITVASAPKLDGDVVDVSSMSDFLTALGQSKQVQECYARQIFRYSFGRSELTPMPVIGAAANTIIKLPTQVEVDNCQLRDGIDAMEAGGGDLKATLIAFLTSDAFRKRIDRKPL